MKIHKKFLLLCLMLTLLLLLSACVNYLPADGDGSEGTSADVTQESESTEGSDIGETESVSAPDDGDIPNQPEDGYTKFY